MSVAWPIHAADVRGMGQSPGFTVIRRDRLIYKRFFYTIQK